MQMCSAMPAAQQPAWPLAHIAMYMVCTEYGYPNNAILAAIDDGVKTYFGESLVQPTDFSHKLFFFGILYYVRSRDCLTSTRIA